MHGLLRKLPPLNVHIIHTRKLEQLEMFACFVRVEHTISRKGMSARMMGTFDAPGWRGPEYMSYGSAACRARDFG
jgi:hypothetical protein